MLTESTAKSRYVRVSDRKAGQVLSLIRGKRVDKALATLAFTNKAAMPAITKTVKSCMAHFGNNVSANEFIIKAAYVGQGPSLKRMRPGPQGRGMMYTRKTCHITITLARS